MLPCIKSLVRRSSPTSRGIVNNTALHASNLAIGQSSSPNDARAMFQRANKDFTASASPTHKFLTKQTLPLSGQPAVKVDIREQFQKSSGSNDNTNVPLMSAKTAQTPTNPLHNSNANLNSRAYPGAATKGSLASLYNKPSSYGQTGKVIDLTGSTPIEKLSSVVQFGEDDFSDDDHLDLDFKAPSAYSGLKMASLSGKGVAPPPQCSNDSEAIPWSSSPQSHFLEPRANGMLSRTSTTATESSLKRQSSGEMEEDEPPRQPKKRVLPASFRKEPSTTSDSFQATGKGTPKSKASAFWDPSASAVKDAREKWKKHRLLEATANSASNAPQSASELSAAEVQSVIASHHPKVDADAIQLSSEQEHIRKLVVENKQSVFFTGPAGTGKSVLMRGIIKDLKKKYAKDSERVAVTASTGLAACNIGGITLHSFSGIGLGKEDATVLVKKIRRNPKAKNRWLRTQCLIIDEISMVDGDLFDKLDKIGRTIRANGRPWGGIQLIVTGDFLQLPPVPDGEKREAKFAFDADTWETSLDHTIGLTEVFRQRDPVFAGMLNELRIGKISEATEKAFKALARPLMFDDGVDPAELFPTRAQVETFNRQKLASLPGTVQSYSADDSGDPNVKDKLLMNVMAPKVLDLRINAQVMLIKNMDDTLVNGSLGKVIAFSDEKTFDMTDLGEFDDKADDAMAKARRKLKGFSRDAEHESTTNQKFPVVQFMSNSGAPRVILCQPEDWKVELPNGEIQAKRSQLPLILAWALSIHKAQGQTLERVQVNLGKVFERGQAYVALSRATSQAGLRVQGFDKKKIMAHPRVIAFYSKLYTVEQANGKKRASVSAQLYKAKDVTKNPQRIANGGFDADEEEQAMAAYGY